MSENWDTFTSYLVAFGTMFAGNIDSIMTWGGFILLVVRLIADVPKAWAQIKKGLFGWL